MGKTERSNGAFGKSDIEGKTAREVASELGKERVSMEFLGKATEKAKPRWVAASELGSERVSNGREHMSQCGQRASFKVSY